MFRIDDVFDPEMVANLDLSRWFFHSERSISTIKEDLIAVELRPLSIWYYGAVFRCVFEVSIYHRSPPIGIPRVEAIMAARGRGKRWRWAIARTRHETHL